MRPESPKQTVLRLRSAAGHLSAVATLLAQGAETGTILAQLAAVQGALEAARRVLIAGLVEDCSKVIRESPCPQARESELVRLVHGLQRSLGKSGWRGGILK